MNAKQTIFKIMAKGKTKIVKLKKSGNSLKDKLDKLEKDWDEIESLFVADHEANEKYRLDVRRNREGKQEFYIATGPTLFKAITNLNKQLKGSDEFI